MRTGLAIWIAAALLLAAPSAAAAEEFAPLDRPGPRLAVPKRELRKSLDCTTDVTDAYRRPVLLIPGTTLTPEVEYEWSWEPALAKLGFPYCALELPGDALGDIQVAAEHVVYAVRQMHKLSGRRVDIIGHSQGGMIGRWGLRFWPDLRTKVGDLVGLAPSNHGTLDAVAVCNLACPAAFWQQRADARFIAALNSGQETFEKVDYTVAYTRLDEVVTPNLDEHGSSSLLPEPGDVSNVAIQDVCPADVSEHLGIGTYDNVAYALAVDALTHPGPADPTRLDAGAVCSRELMPGVDPETFTADFISTGAYVVEAIARAPELPAEPPLACYATATCGGG